jgi:hypothetical protein
MHPLALRAEERACGGRSPVDHAAARAAREWIHADLRQEAVAEVAYDLGSSHFMHLPGDARRALFARLAAAWAGTRCG